METVSTDLTEKLAWLTEFKRGYKLVTEGMSLNSFLLSLIFYPSSARRQRTNLIGLNARALILRCLWQEFKGAPASF